MAGKNQTAIQKRRRLMALYETGDIVRFGRNENGKPVVKTEGEPIDDDIAVWVSPPSPLQREMAVREAQASRARAMLEGRRKEESDQYLNAHAFLANLDFESLVDYALDAEENERMARARRDVLAEKDWADFNSLRDAMRQFEEAGEPWDDPEWKDLLDRDRLFGEQVHARGNEIREADQAGLLLQPREDLEKRALDKRIELAGTAVFMRVYEEWMLFYACRDDEDHSQLFFADLSEMKSAPEQVQEALKAKLDSFITDPVEAKNSQAAGSGSTSSEVPSEPETSLDSIPEESIGF
jgi:hypothetical protein